MIRSQLVPIPFHLSKLSAVGVKKSQGKTLQNIYKLMAIILAKKAIVQHGNPIKNYSSPLL